MTGRTAASGPSSIEELHAWIEERGVTKLVVGGCDTLGQYKGKRIPIGMLEDVLARGVAFSDVFFVLDHSEELIEPPGGADYPHYFPRKEQGFPDIFLRPDPSSIRLTPWHPDTAAITGDYFLASGAAVPIDPRWVLGQVIERARSLGFTAKVGIEFEFYLLKEDFASLEAKGYRNIEALSGRPYTYSVYRQSLDEEVLGGIQDFLERASIPVEAYNPETGPGQFEVNLRYAAALESADCAFFYKSGIKEIAGLRGLMASFIAKLQSDWPGSSCHLHFSLWDARGKNVFYDENLPHRVSVVARQFSAGMLMTLRDFTAFFCPTVNSYKRLVPYSWGATNVSWGLDNRSTALRAICEEPTGARIEHRMPGADVNPYIAIAAALAGGLHGIEQGLEPPDLFDGDAYASGTGFEAVPATLDEALGCLENSKIAIDYLGEDFCGHYAISKRFEVAQERLAVSDWEVRRFIEMA